VDPFVDVPVWIISAPQTQAPAAQVESASWHDHQVFTASSSDTINRSAARHGLLAGFNAA
jgi:hypothetical protein